MNKHVKSMIEKSVLVGGKITDTNGFITFQRLPLNELENLAEDEIAFATHSMGRAIFQFTAEGKIRNIKGVDSHLDNKDNALAQISGTEAIYIPNKNKSYEDSTHPINLVVFKNQQVDVRIRGTSPLEDLEIEAEINSKMKNFGIKLPQITSVKEFPYDIAEEIGLPTKIQGEYDEFTSDYAKENDDRKKYLHSIYGANYQEDLPNGLRPEKMSEYFTRIGAFESEEFKKFAEEKGLSISDFVEFVDSSYSLGQRYGQATRTMESPFRISDLEYYIANNDISAIEDIVVLTEEMLGNEGMSFENTFAKQMGANIAKLMNAGWVCENFMHRQDFSLAGEMCDDAYFDLKQKIKDTREKNKNDESKFQALKNDYIRQFLSQVYFISSNIKVLQDEMKLRGKTEEEIESVLDDFAGTFATSIDFDKIGQTLGTTAESVRKSFKGFVNVPKDYAKQMAGTTRPEGIIYDEAIIRAHNGNNVFYNQLSDKLAQRLHIERSMILVLESAIEATEGSTRTGTIKGQTGAINTIQKQKDDLTIEQKDEQNK